MWIIFFSFFRELQSQDDRIYLLIHNIDGPMLRNDKTQSALARLASQPNVHLICSIDHINAPLIWDQQKLTKLNFAWFDTTTFLPYSEEIRYESSLLVSQSGALALNSLIHVFKSLNQNAREIYLKIVRYQLEATAGDQDDTSPASIPTLAASNYLGLSFGELYRRCREAFLVNSDLTLRAQLTEFRDHKLVTSRKAAVDGIEYLTIPLAKATLKEFLEMQEAVEKQ